MSAFRKGIVAFILLMCLGGVNCFASEVNQVVRTVKVGCVEGNKFLCNQKADENHQGFIPDYIQEINKFMSSPFERYKFIYVFASRERLQEQLNQGELDIIIDYPYNLSQGLVKSSKITDIQLTLSTSKTNQELFYKGISSFRGKNVGYTMPATLAMIEKYEKEHAIDVMPVYYDDMAVLKNDIKQGKLELAALPFYENEEGFKVVDLIDTMELCFISKEKNEPILKHFAEAKHKLQVAFPSFEVQLRDKHLKGIEYELASTKEEQTFMDSAKPIKFAIEKGTKLIQYDEERGKYIGPYAALIDYFTKVYGLPYEVIFADSIDNAIKQKSDILLGMVESPQLGKRYNLVFTEPYIHGVYSYWTEKGKIVDFQSPNNVASIGNIESVHTYIQNYYPHWNVKVYDSLVSSIAAAKSGEVDFIMLDDMTDGASPQLSEKLDRLYDFNVPQLDLSMGINFNNRSGSVVLSLMDRAIMATDGEKISTIMLNNKIPEYNFQSFFEQYYKWFVRVGQLLLLLCLTVAVVHYRKLHKAAYYDKELKMNNRNFLLRFGGKYCKENTSTIVLDIGKLKQINMVLGVQVGDDIRAFVAQVLKNCTDQGAMLALTSSLNYVVILPFVEKQRIDDYLHCVLSNLGEYRDEVVSVALDFHVGIYQNYLNEDVQINLDKAELALFEAKRQKTAVYFYSDELENRVLREKIIDAKMQKALENQEFHMYLQPQYETQTGKICGAEALVRWIEPNGNIIFPDEFIPYFEQSGFIIKLDDYMFEKACRLQRRLIDSGIQPVRIAVNQSRQHANDEDYSQRLKAIADRYDIDYGLIELEITEYIYGNEKKVLESFDNLKKIGFSISIDDFGSGYSSLNMLGGKQVDCIKIDKQFLRQGLLTGKTKNVLTAIVSIAKSLNIQCVCEGVETREQVEFLRQIQCNYLQGFYFARPMEIGKFIYEAYKADEITIVHTV